MNCQVRPPSCTSSSTGSTVVPAASSTTTRFSPASWLSRLDLPTFGLPTIAIRRGPRGASKTSSGASGSASRTASSRSPLPRPCRADTANGSPSPRFHSVAASASARWSSTLLAARTTGLPAASQDLHHGLVGVGDPDVGVDHEQHRVGQADGDLGLQRDLLGQPARFGVPTAGVDDREPAAVPLGVVRHPVARYSRDVLDDRLAAAEDAVDERRLADVGAPHDREDGGRAGSGGVARRDLRPARSGRLRGRSCVPSAGEATGQIGSGATLTVSTCTASHRESRGAALMSSAARRRRRSSASSQIRSITSSRVKSVVSIAIASVGRGQRRGRATRVVACRAASGPPRRRRPRASGPAASPPSAAPRGPPDRRSGRS